MMHAMYFMYIILDLQRLYSFISRQRKILEGTRPCIYLFGHVGSMYYGQIT